MKLKNLLLSFNRGLISRLGLSRVDLARTALSAETMTNWIPRVLGPMSLRPGMEYTGATKSNAVSRSIPFVFSINDTARLEFTNQLLRIWVNDELASTNAVVNTSITNGSFTSNLTGWTDADESGAVSQWQTGGYMALLGDGTSAAIRYQGVLNLSVGEEHHIKVVIARGPVLFRVGVTATKGDYIKEVSLGTGTHFFAFTPAGDFFVRFSSRESYTVLVDRVSIDTTGVIELPTPYTADDLGNIRYVQSGDVVYIACRGYQQRVITRYGDNAWGISLYEPTDGPFLNINTSRVTLTPGALTGDTTLDASDSIFTEDHVGSLWRLESAGQTVTQSISAQNTFTNEIRVTGVGGQRTFGIIVAGTFSATVTLQYSIAEPGTWIDAATYTSATSTSYSDALDNQIIYYRIGVKTGGYTSGTVTVTLSYTSGSITGIAQATAYTDENTLAIRVLQDFGGTAATADWYEGQWSDERGWPTAVSLHEGRLWWAGSDKINGTISDDFFGFDDEFEGDAGPISRSLGEGPVDNINWLMSLDRLVIGTESFSANVTPARMDQTSVLSARSSSFDEPLTPTNFNIKYGNTKAIFVDQSETRLLNASYDVNSNDYLTNDLMLMVPDLGEAGIVSIAIQRTPDPRVHCVFSDGTVGVLVFDSLESVMCWVMVETDGDVEDVCILPRADEDAVYYTVKRTVNGSTVRYHEKWAMLSECVGGTLNKQADSFYEYSGAAVTTITGLSHLEGETVVVWANGKDLGTKVVSSGQITGLSESVTGAIIGLSYEARYKSVKQAIATEAGVPLNEAKKIDSIGLVLADTHKDGIEFGPDFTTMDSLPAIEDGVAVDADYVWESYDEPMITFPGNWDTNSVLCLRATAPKPCTVLSVAVSITS